MPPAPGRDLREGMNAASGTARTRDNTRQWDGHAQPNSPTFPPGPIIWLPAGHPKDASGTAARPGSRPVLDPGHPLAGKGGCAGKEYTGGSPAMPGDSSPGHETTGQTALAPGPLLQG